MKKLIYIFCLLTFSAITLQAQKNKPKTETNKKKTAKKSFIQYRGNIGIYYDVYAYNQTNYDNFRARYPDNLFRLNASLLLSFGKYFTIPIRMNVTNQKVLFTYPQLPQGNIVDYIRNPKNDISITPRYKWIRGYIGTQTPMYSSLTTGDTRLFGIGIDLNPKSFILSASHGESQIAIEPNKEFNMEGAYRQKMSAFRIGVGSITGSKFTLNVVKVKDDITSVKVRPLYNKPIEGITISPLLQVRLFKNVFLETETAGSVYTNNIEGNDPIKDPLIDKLGQVITVNETSQIGLANTSSLMWKSSRFMLGGEFKFVSASFVPVGYRNAERNYMDYKFKTDLHLFKNTTHINAVFGIRNSNVQETSVEGSQRIIGNFSLNSRITKKFSINANFSNFGFTNSNGLTQQSKIEITNNTFSISPSYNFNTKKIRHLLNLTTSLMNYKQFDATSTSYVNTKSKNLNLVYGMFFKKMPLRTQFSGLFLKNEMPTNELSIINLGTSIGYHFFNKKLQTKLTLNYVNVKRENFTPDRRITSNLRLSYKITKKMNFSVNYRINQYKYGSSKPDASTGEHRLQFALNTNF